MAPPKFPAFGSKARDLLTKDYNFYHKFTLSLPYANGLGLIATGVRKDQLFIGDISMQYKSGNTKVDLKLNTYSNLFAKLTFEEALPGIKTSVSVHIPDQKSGKVDVLYRNYDAAVKSSVGLTLSPLLDFNAAIGIGQFSLGGEVAFDTASASFSKCNAGITFNQPDFSAALIVMDKGQTIKASCFYSLDPSTAVAAEMTHKISDSKNSFMIGSSHVFDPIASFKTRLANDGKVGLLCQREWRRAKLLATFSAEYDIKATASASKFGVSLSLKA